MKLTIEKIKEYWISKNISRVNNINDTFLGGQLYNDSVNLYESITTVLGEQDINSFSVTQNPTFTALTVGSITQSIAAATTVVSGVMSNTDKISLENLKTLVGVSTANLGTFSGSIISDNTTIKAALQELEIAIGSGQQINYDYSNSSTYVLTTANMVYLVPSSNLTVDVNSMTANKVYYVYTRLVSPLFISFAANTPNSIWFQGQSVTETSGSAGTVPGAYPYHAVYQLIRIGNIIFITPFNL